MLNFEYLFGVPVLVQMSQFEGLRICTLSGCLHSQLTHIVAFKFLANVNQFFYVHFDIKL